MSELIDREQLLDMIHVSYPDDGSVYQQGRRDNLEWVREIIESMPASGFAHGTARWKSSLDDKGKRTFRCQCGHVAAAQTRHCPGCGALMLNAAWP